MIHYGTFTHQLTRFRAWLVPDRFMVGVYPTTETTSYINRTFTAHEGLMDGMLPMAWIRSHVNYKPIKINTMSHAKVVLGILIGNYRLADTVIELVRSQPGIVNLHVYIMYIMLCMWSSRALKIYPHPTPISWCSYLQMCLIYHLLILIWLCATCAHSYKVNISTYMYTCVWIITCCSF